MGLESGFGRTGRLCGARHATGHHRLPHRGIRRCLPRLLRTGNGTVRQAAYARPASKQPTRRVAAPPPEPPPLASGRVRTAELAASMLWAAPLVALLTIPAAALLGIDLSSDPQQLAFLYGMTLLGTWTTLVPNKLIEARKLDGTNRRLIALAAGLLVGGVGLVLARIATARLEPAARVFR